MSLSGRDLPGDPQLAHSEITVAVPTFTGGAKLQRCLESLRAQRYRPLRVVVVEDGRPGVSQSANPDGWAEVITLPSNQGYGAALNTALHQSSSEFFACLNDDVVVDPNCLEEMVSVMRKSEDIGTCAPRILLTQERGIDSAGMGIAADGTFVQRGHSEAPQAMSKPADVLCASGCAALFRRAALEEAGPWDESLFMYCEDADLGLRLARLCWRCRYVPSAFVYHEYSATTGAASARKLYLVERNRMLITWKNLPLRRVLISPFATAVRYGLHAKAFFTRKGLEGHARSEGATSWDLVRSLAKAHADALGRLPRIWSQRRRLRHSARLTDRQFLRFLRAHSIPLSRVAGRE